MKPQDYHNIQVKIKINLKYKNALLVNKWCHMHTNRLPIKPIIIKKNLGWIQSLYLLL